MELTFNAIFTWLELTYMPFDKKENTSSVDEYLNTTENFAKVSNEMAHI